MSNVKQIVCRFWQMKRTRSESKCDDAGGGASSTLLALTIEPRASDVGSSVDGAKGSGSMVDRPFLLMILSAADAEFASSSWSELLEKVKMILPLEVHHWIDRLGCKPPIVSKDFRPCMHQ